MIVRKKKTSLRGCEENPYPCLPSVFVFFPLDGLQVLLEEFRTTFSVPLELLHLVRGEELAMVSSLTSPLN